MTERGCPSQAVETRIVRMGTFTYHLELIGETEDSPRAMGTLIDSGSTVERDVVVMVVAEGNVDAEEHGVVTNAMIAAAVGQPNALQP